MPNITVCARFRPLSSKERRGYGDGVYINAIDDESFFLKDEKDEDTAFSFDRVFYEKSNQADVYEFLALPIVQDAVKGINGTIITYGQTGAGKTYTMEGTSILETDEQKKGLLPRVVDGLFSCLGSSDEATKLSIKLSMVEIYMEKVRDLFDMSKDNIKIKESRMQEIMLAGVTEVLLLGPAEALQNLSGGIANRAVGETQMNIKSSRSHCVYMFTVQQEYTLNKSVRTGKLVLVDLAGSEKVEKTGAEGRILEEAKTINKSLSALGNVINALTSGSPGKTTHIPYRDSKLTRILQDALGGNSRTALLCCCSPSSSNISESLSTLRFAARARHVKTTPCVNRSEDKHVDKSDASSTTGNKSCQKSLNNLRESVGSQDVQLLKEPAVQDGTSSAEETVTEETISSSQSAVEELTLTVEKVQSAVEELTLTVENVQSAVDEMRLTVEELRKESKVLKSRVEYTESYIALKRAEADASFQRKLLTRRFWVAILCLLVFLLSVPFIFGLHSPDHTDYWPPPT